MARPSETNRSDPAAALPRRAEITAYSTAFFSVSLLPMTLVIVPLWALELGASATMIGVAMGARSLMPFLFSIHGGALLDRLGVRRVMVVCAAASAGLALLYPAVPLIGALILFQVVGGFLQTMGWIGAQTQIGQLTRGNPVYMGRFTFIATLANFFTPALAGFAWDLAGPWGAFGAIAVWSCVLCLSSSAMPVPPGMTVPTGRPALRELMPAFTDYREAFVLALAPAVGFVVLCSFLMNATISMRFAFLPVYFESVGLDGSTIGLLVGCASLAGAPSALLAGRVARLMRPHFLLLGLIVTAALGIGATPGFAGVWSLLALTCLFGSANGLGMAFIMSLLSRAVPTGQLGRSIGLRTTANRFSSLTIPVLMGLAIDLLGMASGFVVTAALIAATTVASAGLARRAVRDAAARARD